MKNVALVPGILGFERLGRINYFNGVAEHVRQSFPQTIHIQPFDTDPLGSVEDRSKRLAEQITAVFGSEPVHVFAHSMGGLDARFLVARHQTSVAKQVRSITAIGTPHKGSPIASILNNINPLDRLTQLADLLDLDDFILRELKTKANALHDLTESVAIEFNQLCPDQVQTVSYHEVVGLSRQGRVHTSVPFLLPFAILHSRHLENDGVVPVDSAIRPNRDPLERWPADHADMVGHDLNNGATAMPQHFDHRAAYRRLVERIVIPARD